MKIDGRTFVISGGASGLGLSTSTQLLFNGANVAILDLNSPPATSDSLLQDSSRTLFVSTDVSSSSSITSALSSINQWIKSTSKPLGGVVCCAGIGVAERALPKQAPNATTDAVKMMNMKIFDRALAINLRGTVDLIRQTIPHLSLNAPEGLDGERGVVIVVSSVAAYEGQVGQLAYSASKGAVASMVLPLARELGQAAGIRVMGIAPGLFETGMTSRPQFGSQASKATNESSENDDWSEPVSSKPKKGFNPNMIEYPVRMGRPEEFARLVKEIVENPMLNGQVLRLDGAVRMPARL